jgi:hypothetical protein
MTCSFMEVMCFWNRIWPTAHGSAHYADATKTITVAISISIIWERTALKLGRTAMWRDVTTRGTRHESVNKYGKDRRLGSLMSEDCFHERLYEWKIQIRKTTTLDLCKTHSQQAEFHIAQCTCTNNKAGWSGYDTVPKVHHCLTIYEGAGNK